MSNALRRSPWRAYSLHLVWAAAALVYALALVHGPGEQLSPDSFAYLQAAEAFRDGQVIEVPASQPGGGWEPLGWYPPLYPVVIGTLARLGFSTLEATTILGVVCYAAFAVLLWELATRLFDTGRARAAFMVLTLGAGVYITYQEFVWSERLFMPLVVASLLAQAKTAQCGSRRWAAAAGGLAGLAILTRYVGVFLPAPVLVLSCAAALRAPTGRERLRALQGAVVAGALAFGPVAVWFARNYGLIGRAVPYFEGTQAVGVHPTPVSALGIFTQLVVTAAESLRLRVPQSVLAAVLGGRGFWGLVVLVTGLFGITAFAIWSARATIDEHPPRQVALVKTLAIFLLVYEGGVICLSYISRYSFVNQGDRIVGVPVFCLTALVVWAYDRRNQSDGRLAGLAAHRALAVYLILACGLAVVDARLRLLAP